MNQATRAIVSKLAPAFKAQAWYKGQISQISNKDFAGKYYCLFFYPFDFTFVCPTEILEFNSKVPSFEKLNCALLGCSGDSVFSHIEWTKKPLKEGGLGELYFPLLSDISRQMATDYGCLNDEAHAALRATYIVDDTGILRHASINDLSVGRNVDEVLRLVEAYQYTAKHGEVCPASWRTGQRTLEPSPFSEMTKKYWEEVHAKKNK